MRKINLDGIIDKHKYKDLALLFDRPDFQKYLKKLEKQIIDDHKKYPDLANYLLNSKGGGLARVIVQKFKYPLGFTRAVLYAAAYGKVIENDVVHCYSHVLMHPLSALDSYTPTFTRDDLVIFVDPQVIKRNKTVILDEIGLLLDGVLQTTNPLPKKHPLNEDPKSDIRRDREWYWMWLTEKEKDRGAYNRIVNTWNNKCSTPNLDPHEKCAYCVSDNNVVEQAVSRYRKALLVKIS